jgi:hypothetical protein
MSTLLRRLGSRRGRTYPYAFVHWFLEKLKFSQGEVMVALPLVVDAQGSRPNRWSQRGQCRSVLCHIWTLSEVKRS